MRILDATSSRRIMWENKHDLDTVYMDIRPEVVPDVIGDVRSVPFDDNIFDLVVFDPPHKSLGVNSTMADRYGIFTDGEIRAAIAGGFAEIGRILRENGLCLFKWSDGDFPLGKMANMRPPALTVLVTQRVSYRNKSGNQCFWVTLIKRSKEKSNNETTKG